MRSVLSTALMLLLAATALAQDSDNAIGNETVTADQAQDAATTESAAEAKEPEIFKVPAGYRAKTRGKRIVYCKKETEHGTRFSSEKCFDEAQLKARELARQLAVRGIRNASGVGRQSFWFSGAPADAERVLARLWAPEVRVQLLAF